MVIEHKEPLSQLTLAPIFLEPHDETSITAAEVGRVCKLPGTNRPACWDVPHHQTHGATERRMLIAIANMLQVVESQQSGNSFTAKQYLVTYLFPISLNPGQAAAEMRKKIVGGSSLPLTHRRLGALRKTIECYNLSIRGYLDRVGQFLESEPSRLLGTTFHHNWFPSRLSASSHGDIPSCYTLLSLTTAF